jgi:hypothetical protein
MTATTVTEQSVTGAIDALVTEAATGPIVPVAPAPQPRITVSFQQMEEMGLIVPVATPAIIRAAFEERQRLLAAILSDDDYMFMVPVQSQGRTRNQICNTRAEAESICKKLGLTIDYIKGTPKKTGIAKLAVALGITARRVRTTGLPDDDKAPYAYSEYEASHRGSGKTEVGVGWCDSSERNGMSKHDIIATADTRAYNRAILRLSGFGDVSGDELVPMPPGHGVEVTDDRTEKAPPRGRAPAPLPLVSEDQVLIAARTWAQLIADRDENERFASPAKQQANSGWRFLRAKARRGDQYAAAEMGTAGIPWEGEAQDAPLDATFVVEASPVSYLDVLRARHGTAGNEVTDVEPVERAAAQASPAKYQEPPQEAGPPGATFFGPEGHRITDAQIQRLSTELLRKFGTKDKAKAWLKENLGLDSTRELHEDRYEQVLAMIPKEG